ncbi:Aldehyde reductase 2 [Paramyrothecium foliicola]|nr:Aldehyde reductase 2 [Paramyrothecium foliicola]
MKNTVVVNSNSPKLATWLLSLHATGVIHTAAPVPGPNVKLDVNLATNATLHIFQSASRFSNIKRVVYTSSASAITSNALDSKSNIEPETFNTEAVLASKNHVEDPDSKGLDHLIYGASKTLAEQALWKWYREEKPHFELNVVVPPLVLGEVLDIKGQGLPSTTFYINLLWQGDAAKEVEEAFRPQWFIDVVDLAIIHLGALIIPKVKDKRLLAYAVLLQLSDIYACFRAAHWTKKMDNADTRPADIGRVANQEALEILQTMNEKSWTDVQTSLRPLCQQMAQMAKSS